ncbi:hypothetical protein ACFC1L_32895 [Streptomyces sp. NPDC056210]|uniref:hypothetical protein n=1 Tax=unclassified Streptomyces TaxID=2593676 RepID=UPI0035E05EFC
MLRKHPEQGTAGRSWLPATRRGRLTTLAIAAAVVAGGTIAGAAASRGDAKPRVVAAQFSELYPTLTASDWVTHGDHAVVVEVMPGSERRGAIPEDKKDNGEGFIPRTATMKVDEVLWSKSGAEAAPQTYEADLLGWWWEGDSEREFAWKGEPRYEEGHKYISLLVKGDDGKWKATLHAMPYDDQTVGAGEVAGTVGTASASRATEAASETGEPEGLETEAYGKDADTVKRILNTATPMN